MARVLPALQPCGSGVIPYRLVGLGPEMLARAQLRNPGVMTAPLPTPRVSPTNARGFRTRCVGVPEPQS